MGVLRLTLFGEIVFGEIRARMVFQWYWSPASSTFQRPSCMYRSRQLIQVLTVSSQLFSLKEKRKKSLSVVQFKNIDMRSGIFVACCWRVAGEALRCSFLVDHAHRFSSGSSR